MGGGQNLFDCVSKWHLNVLQVANHCHPLSWRKRFLYTQKTVITTKSHTLWSNRERGSRCVTSRGVHGLLERWRKDFCVPSLTWETLWGKRHQRGQERSRQESGRWVPVDGSGGSHGCNRTQAWPWERKREHGWLTLTEEAFNLKNEFKFFLYLQAMADIH